MFSRDKTKSSPYRTCLGFLVLALALSPVHYAYAAGSGWVLTQRSKELGDQYVYLTPSGLKCVNPRQGLGLITRAPAWDISFYNDKTRLYYSLAFSSWKRKLEARGKTTGNLIWRKSQFGHIAGLKATKYLVTKSASAPPSRWVSADYWVADDIKVPAQLADMLSTAYGLPVTRSIPLRVTYKDINGQSETILDTYQGQSHFIPQSYLAAPKDYRLAKSELDVMMTDENRQLVNDIAKDLGSEPPSISTSNRESPRPLSLPNNGITLPNGQTLSKEEISKYIDAYKQYRQTGK